MKLSECILTSGVFFLLCEKVMYVLFYLGWYFLYVAILIINSAIS